jgi:hypothetical protein
LPSSFLLLKANDTNRSERQRLVTVTNPLAEFAMA